MFKKIPGSTQYRINLKRQVIDEYGCLVDLKRVSRYKVSIELFGKERSIELEWLALAAWYEIEYIRDVHLHLDNIKFLKCDHAFLNIECKHVMVFNNPIYYKDGFRYIAGYHRYAIDNNGNVLDTENNTIIDHKLSHNDYTTVYIYSCDKSKNRTIAKHINTGNVIKGYLFRALE